MGRNRRSRWSWETSSGEGTGGERFKEWLVDDGDSAAQGSKDDKGVKRVAGSGNQEVRAARRGGLRLDKPERSQE